MITIRKVNINDAQVLALLARVTYSESHAHLINSKPDLLSYNNHYFSIENIKNEIADNKNVFYIAFSKNFPVGYFKIVKNYKTEYVESDNICKLERIYVLEEFIAQKIGYQLMSLAIEKASNLNFEQIWLSVHVDNSKAINFYKKNDFKDVGRLFFDVNGKKFPNIVFSKNLKS